MASTLFTFTLRSAEATAELAAALGAVLQAGDIVLLDGQIGAGKTHLARSLIQSLQTVSEDVPSPTFTLVQTYDTQKGELWHADLYRLSTSDEVFETGLFDAMGQAICLIEWPDRLGPVAPDTALTLHFDVLTDMDHRQITFTSNATDLWRTRLEGAFDTA